MDKLRLSYTQTGKAIWISHLDMMRMLQRAMNRADIPIRYSEGFNPHAQISILLPLSVGTESLCQIADIRVRADVDLSTLPQRLTDVMPEGIVVTDCWENGAKATEMKLLEAQSRWEYIEKPNEKKIEAIRDLFARKELIVQRKTKRGEGPFDILPYTQLKDIYIEGNCVILRTILSAAEPVVKPELLSKAVIENAPELAPENVRCTRLKLLRSDGKVFH